MPLTKSIIETHIDPSTNSLDLSNMNLTDEYISSLCEYLKSHPEITSLDISDNYIGDGGAKILASNTTITTLSIDFNEIDVMSAKALANNRVITSLSIIGNDIGDEGAMAFAENQTLISLQAAGNSIFNEGAKALARNTSLVFLDISGNRIGSEGIKSFSKNKHIISLDLTSNDIFDDAVIELAKNTTITSLSIAYNNLSDEGAIALAKNTTIKTLDVSFNDIGNEGAIALIEKARLTALNIVHNQLNTEGFSGLEVIGAVCNNQTLLELKHDFRDMMAISHIDKLLARNKKNHASIMMVNYPQAPEDSVKDESSKRHDMSLIDESDNQINNKIFVELADENEEVLTGNESLSSSAIEAVFAKRITDNDSAEQVVATVNSLASSDDEEMLVVEEYDSQVERNNMNLNLHLTSTKPKEAAMSSSVEPTEYQSLILQWECRNTSKLVDSILKTISRLPNGSKKSKIIDIINNVPLANKDDKNLFIKTLESDIQDSQSKLYQALNMHRGKLPITLNGPLSFFSTKTRGLQEAISSLNTQQREAMSI
jgi:Leucine Rich repeat